MPVAVLRNHVHNRRSPKSTPNTDLEGQQVFCGAFSSFGAGALAGQAPQRFADSNWAHITPILLEGVQSGACEERRKVGRHAACKKSVESVPESFKSWSLVWCFHAFQEVLGAQAWRSSSRSFRKASESFENLF